MGSSYENAYHRAMSPSALGGPSPRFRSRTTDVPTGSGSGSASGSGGASRRASGSHDEDSFWDASQHLASAAPGGNLASGVGDSLGMYHQQNVSAPHIDGPGASSTRGPPLADDLGFDQLSIHPEKQSQNGKTTSGSRLAAVDRANASYANQEIYQSASEVHPENSLGAIADQVDQTAAGLRSDSHPGSAPSSVGGASTAHQHQQPPEQSYDHYQMQQQQHPSYDVSQYQQHQQYPYYQQQHPEAGQSTFAGGYDPSLYPSGQDASAYPDAGQDLYPSQQQQHPPNAAGYDPALYAQGGGWYGPDGAYYDDRQRRPSQQQYGYDTFAQLPAHHQQANGYFAGGSAAASSSQVNQYDGNAYMNNSQAYGVDYPGGPQQGPYSGYGAPSDPSGSMRHPGAGGYMPSLARQPTGMSVASVRSNNSAAARRRSKDAAAKQQQQQLPFNKAFVEEYRHRMKGDPDPEAQFAYARYLIEAAKKVQDPRDGPKQARKYRDALLSDSLKLIKRLATTGMGLGKPPYAEAQFFLANCFGNGSLGLQVDHEKAYNLYVQASKQNHAAATYRTAVCNEVGAGTRRDHHRAVLFYRKASALGDTAGMYKLGMILLNGMLGQPRNIREAIVWLKRAAGQADEDNPHALHELGLLHEKPNNNVVPVDEAYARELFTQAAQLGYAPSQFKLGSAYEYGSLTCPVDPRRSIAWYTKAAGKNDGESELALSGWYLTGSEGVLKQSDSEAYLWARRAATKGIPKAEYAVGYYSEVGIGVTANIEEAKRWYMRAAAQGNKRAMMRLTELKQQRNTRTGKKGARPTRKDAEKECVVM